jgi:putative cell wall-binding protein
VLRAAGTDPALTSVVAGRLARPDARAVVLVNGSTADAVGQVATAATLASARSAALLLTDAGALPAVVAQDVAARHATTAWLVGPTALIAPAVEQQLRALGVTTVTRVVGPDRWATAAAVAAAVGAPSRQAVLVSGDPGELQTALLTAAAAGSAGRPVLLTSRSAVPAATLDALAALQVTSVTVVGSTDAVPDPTLDALAAVGVAHVSRVTGRDRWAMATAVADRIATGPPSERVVLASGLEAGADLLVASGQARRILLTDRDAPAPTTAVWLASHATADVTLIAGPDAVTTPVLRAATDAHR